MPERTNQVHTRQVERGQDLVHFELPVVFCARCKCDPTRKRLGRVVFPMRCDVQKIDAAFQPEQQILGRSRTQHGSGLECPCDRFGFARASGERTVRRRRIAEDESTVFDGRLFRAHEGQCARTRTQRQRVVLDEIATYRRRAAPRTERNAARRAE